MSDVETKEFEDRWKDYISHLSRLKLALGVDGADEVDEHIENLNQLVDDAVNSKKTNKKK